MKANKVEPLLKDDGCAEEVPLGDIGVFNKGASIGGEARFKQKAKKIASVKAITQAKLSSTQWKDKATRFVMKRSRSKRSRQRKPFNVVDTLNVRKYQQATLSDIEDDEESTSNETARTYEDGTALPNDLMSAKGKNVDSHSKALLHYFAKVASSGSEEEVIDLDFVHSLIVNGASVHTTDRHGQSALHEAARDWDLGIAEFLLKYGLDVNIADKYGRTPLHVAAAVDYPEMVQFLILRDAAIGTRTYGEDQTPLHYAAKNDATQSLKMLLKYGASIEDRDYKERTPLQIAAELDRSETARILVEQGSHAGVRDINGLSALVLMITKMPSVAKEALNQFHSLDRANRREYYFLNFLEPVIPRCLSSGDAKTPLEVVVEHKQFDLIMHPVFQRLIKVKWMYFGRSGTWIQMIMNVGFVLVWTILAICLPSNTADHYTPVSKNWWRIGLEGLAVLLTLVEIYVELKEFSKSKKEHHKWLEWREKQLISDLDYCHPRWPEERKYIKQEMTALHSQDVSYFHDSWNYFDWVTYAMIGITILTHIIKVTDASPTTAKVNRRVLAATIVFIWLRLMKTARAFTSLGPFVVMLNHFVGDTFKFAFLYLLFYIPFAVAFWMIFGAEQNTAVEGYGTVEELLFTMLRLTVVDDYNFDGLQKADPLMARLLCGIYLTLSAIICLNLFIALMSDTFQRVYDNAKANAVMEQAAMILNLESKLSVKKRKTCSDFVQEQCNPEELYYDDDSVNDTEGELKKITFQVKDQVDDVHAILSEVHSGQSFKSRFESDLDALRHTVSELHREQQITVDKVESEVSEIKKILKQMMLVQSKTRRRRSTSTEGADVLPAINETNYGDQGYFQG